MLKQRSIANGFLGLFLLCLAAFLPDSASAKSCSASGDGPAIRVRLEEGKLAYNTAEGVKALTRRMRPNEDPGIKSIYSFGLTSVEWRTKADLELTGVPVGDTSYCWFVAEVNMTIALNSTVFVAKEIERSSCSWREVMNHEQKHVALNKKMFARLPADIKPKIMAAAQGGAETPEGNAAMAKFRPQIERAIDQALKKFSAAREKQHRTEIDTKAEYDRVDAACPEAEWDAVFRRAGLK